MVSNQQLYVAIGIPIAVNMLFNGLLIGAFYRALGRRIKHLKDRERR